MEGKRIGRNTDMNELFGLDEPALPADTAEEAPKESDEYQRWLEESLKENKGYGTKGAYEGEPVQEEFDCYTGTTWEAYDKMQQQAQEEIVRLVRKDKADKERDELILSTLAPVSIMRSGTYTGDASMFVPMFLGFLWYIFTAAAGIGIGYGVGLRGTDLFIMAGIGGVLGAILRYNGKEGYHFAEALAMSSVELGLFAGFAAVTLCYAFTDLPDVIAIGLPSILSAVGMYIKQRFVLERKGREVFYKTIRFILVPVPITILVGLLTK